MAVHVVTAGQMRELDRRATEEYGIPSLLLMENAGLQAVLELERAFPRVTQCRVAVVCGKGNNGGDGFVAARHLFNRGVAVEVVLLARQTETKAMPGPILRSFENWAYRSARQPPDRRFKRVGMWSSEPTLLWMRSWEPGRPARRPASLPMPLNC